MNDRAITKRAEVILYLLEAVGALGIWFLLRPETWGERVGTGSFILIYLVIISVISYFYGKKPNKDRPKT